jgi:steroid delta-isomerase-like uncharacterized protein
MRSAFKENRYKELHMLRKLVSALFLPLFGVTVLCQAQPANEQEKNKTVARAFFEDVLGQGKLEKYADSHTEKFVAHGTERNFTLAEDIAAAREERTAMPDMQIAFNRMVAEADLVAVHWTAWGTNTQPGMGLPATGKKIKVSGITIFRFEAGKISEEWSAWNMLSVLRQAGLFPPNP